MKIRAKVTGTVIDLSEAGARKLIAAGIYDAVEEPKKEKPKPKEKPTKVEPLTTEDLPTVPTKTVA